MQGFDISYILFQVPSPIFLRTKTTKGWHHHTALLKTLHVQDKHKQLAKTKHSHHKKFKRNNNQGNTYIPLSGEHSLFSPNSLTFSSFSQFKPIPSAYNFMPSPSPIVFESPILWRQERHNMDSFGIRTQDSAARAQLCNQQTVLTYYDAIVT